MDFLLTQTHIYFNMVRYPEGDPRVSQWPLMQGPEVVLLLTSIYLLIVTCGPAYMSNRRPMDAKWLMVLYNFSMVTYSIYMFYQAVTTAIEHKLSIFCQNVDYSYTKEGLREASNCWIYFITKIVEFLDTVFFVLRKKNKQITFLHVYHHASMAVFSWYAAKYVPGGEKMYPGLINTFVHTVMYTYYGLAALGTHMQKYLWWKKWLTTLQMAQFLSVNVRCVLSILDGPCGFPTWINYFTILNSTFFFCLFCKFYRGAYHTKHLTVVKKTA